VDTSFNPGIGANAPVHCVIALTNGQVMVGGSFSDVSGQLRHRIARLNANGSLDSGFVPPLLSSGSVYCIKPQPDGRVLVVGDFQLASGAGQKGIMRLRSDGSLDTGFNTGLGANDAVFAVDLQSDGRIMVAGSFTRINGVIRNRFARLLSDGSLDPEFDPGIGANNTVYALAMLPNDNIMIGGNFTEVSGVPRRGVARIIGTVVIPLDIASISLVGGQAHITIASQPGQSYILQATSDLLFWQNILTNTAAGPTLDLIDVNAGAFPHRFYRIQSPTP
jgi:uncharacterized delta-60 repeat protein